MKARYFIKVLGITIFSLLLLNSHGIAQIHYDNTGKVGIGTTSPGAALDTAGVIRSTNYIGSGLTGEGVEILYLTGSSQGYVQAYDRAESNYEKLNIEGSPVIINTLSSGNVGIGTTSPDKKVHIYGSPDLDPHSFAGKVEIESPSFFNGQLRIKNTDSSGIYDETSIGFVGKSNRFWVMGPGAGTGAISNKFGIGYGTGNPDIDGAGSLFTLTNNGNVGIGTTTPGSKLEVVGNVDADGFTINGVPVGTSTDSYWSGTGGNIYRNTGNVGIGTTEPVEALTTGTSKNIQLGVADGGGAALFFRRINTQTDPTPPLNGAGIYYNWDTGNAEQLVFNLAGSEKVVFNVNGNVGIGTTSPDSRMEINGRLGIGNNFEDVVENYGIVLGKSGSGDHSESIEFIGSIAGPGWGNKIYSVQGNLLFLSRDGITTWTERMRIARNSGNVGIGTTNPSEKLTIKSSYSDHIFLDRGDGVGGKIYQNGSGMYFNAGGDFHFITDISQKVTIKEFSGNVGIGTTSPTEKLDVTGTVKATSFVGDGSQLTGINGSGQWSEGTGGIYYNNSNVGIGTTSPNRRLHIYNNTANPWDPSGKVQIDSGAFANGQLRLVNTYSSDPYDETSIGFIGKNNRFWLIGAGAGVGAISDKFGIAYGEGDPDIDTAAGLLTITNNGNVGIGTTSPGVKLDVQGEIRSLVNGTEFYMVPKGAIIMWSGPITYIPSGWALCDGANGTPDLRDRFILSVADKNETPGAKGGKHDYNLSVAQLPSHSHTGTTTSDGLHQHNYYSFVNSGITNRRNWRESSSDPGSNASLYTVENITPSGQGGHSHSIVTDPIGSGQPIDNRPAFYKLAFIMKL